MLKSENLIFDEKNNDNIRQKTKLVRIVLLNWETEAITNIKPQSK